MSFINDIKEKAKKDIKTIVLPEASDARVVGAAAVALTEGYANIVLVGNESEIKNIAEENNYDN